MQKLNITSTLPLTPHTSASKSLTAVIHDWTEWDFKGLLQPLYNIKDNYMAINDYRATGIAYVMLFSIYGCKVNMSEKDVTWPLPQNNNLDLTSPWQTGVKGQ